MLRLLTIALCIATADTTISQSVDEVVVTGTRSVAERNYLPTTVTTIARSTLENQYRQSIIPTLTEEVPGLFSTSRGLMGYGVSANGAGKLSVRGIGNTPNTGMLVLIDGMPQYAGLMGHPVPDAYQTALAEKVEVVRGPSSMLYGSNAMGGVVNIITRQERKNGVYTDLTLSGGSYGTLQGEMTNRVKCGPFSSIFSLNYGSTDGHRKDSKYNQLNGFLKLGYDISRRWMVSGDIDLTHFNLQNPGEDTNPYIDCKQRVNRGMTSIALRNNYRKTSGAASFFYNWGHHSLNDGYHPGEKPRNYLFKSDDSMMGVALYQNLKLMRGNTTTLGFDYKHLWGKAWNDMVTGEQTLLTDKKIDETAGYLDFHQVLTSWMSVNAGVRVDNNSVAGTEIVPQGGLSFALPHQIQTKAIVSKGYRNPTIKELYMFAARNPELEPERLWNYEVAFSQTIANRFSYGLNLFYIKADNLIQTVKVEGKNKNINTGEAEHYGAELTADYIVNRHFKTNVNYSYLHMKDPVLASPEHKLNVAATYNGHRLSIHPVLSYVSGLYTRLGDSEHKENYLLANLTATYHLCPQAHIFVKGENLLTQKYEIYDGFPMPKATFMGGLKLQF